MLTVIPQPENIPPRVLLELNSGGSPFAEAQIRRDGELIRQKPVIGTDTIAVYDYEAPFGRAITYSISGTLEDESSFSESLGTLLDVKIGWMIHPRQPSLSYPLPDLSVSRGGLLQLGETTNTAQATEFNPIGSELPIVVISGSRQADNRIISIVTVTKSEKRALTTLLRNEVPLVFRFPTSWDMEFEEGFYKIGDVRRSPYIDERGEWLLRWDLPIQKVRPVVSTLQAQHTWQDILDDNEVWGSLLLKYSSWYDLLLDRTA